MFPYLYGDGVDGYEFDEKLTADERKAFLTYIFRLTTTRLTAVPGLTV